MNAASQPTVRFTRYLDCGHPVKSPDANSAPSLAEDAQFMRENPQHTLLNVYPTPTASDIEQLGQARGLHPLLVEDLLQGEQRPKLEIYDDVVFLVLRSTRYLDASEEVEFSEFHVVLTPQSVDIFCQDDRWIDGRGGVDKNGRLSNEEEWEAVLLGHNDALDLRPGVIVYRFLDAIVDSYLPVLRGIAVDKEQIERQVFSGDQAVARRIYRLSQEIIDMQHATTPAMEVMEALRREMERRGMSSQLKAYLDDATDHLTFANNQVLEFRAAMSQILDVNATLVTERQNEDMKKISGWAAILFAPTLVAAIYGMNFDVMPELHWVLGYPMALCLMAMCGVGLRLLFKYNRWM
ncbi:magnesium and cobalt transport protein CorA [Corynebacterium suicordis]|uniref:Magnesium and cobalt transport protein CorA n=1 Tax=Corynebacterium suicordis DSM 45110 TaxID=1121369 RepID=A0ABR9ZH63_9CORY|nr:magnesium and cobalt transport protein CorA [Corynebacterium suicordis]MBF4552752.1 magnesium and cobalt transport protein CorA [Corynebacterium suicordis DSM 45110]MDR6278289.1 magnesium transporter [Corynebacterium suicordis]